MDLKLDKLATIRISGVNVPPIAFTPEPEKYYVEEGGTWTPYSEKNVRLRLKDHGFDDTAPRGESMSQVDEAVLAIQRQRGIDIAIPLAGWPSGLLRIEGRRILVTEGAEVLKAEDVPCDNLLKYLEEMFGKEALPYFIGWLQRARENIGIREMLPGQIPIFVGPANAGKSLLQKYVTRLLNCKDACPYDFMRGKSSFNEDLFESAHLVVEDRFFEGGRKNSREFGAAMKEIAVNHVQRCHGKYKKGVTLWPKWRMTMSMNDERDNLRCLPPMDESIKDKIMLFMLKRATFSGLNMGSLKDWRKWDEITKKEMPGLAHYIDNYDLGDLAAPRFGVKAWHDKELMEEEAEGGDEFIFLQCIEHDLPLVLNGEKEWTGTTLDLKRTLESDLLPSWRQTRSVLYWTNACGTHLGKLAARYPKAFARKKNRGRRTWTINLGQLTH